MAEITVDAPLKGVTVIAIPGWTGDYRVEARTDGRDVVTLRTTSTLGSERWVPISSVGGRLAVISYATRADEVRAMESGKPSHSYTAPLVVLLPPARLNTIRLQLGKE